MKRLIVLCVIFSVSSMLATAQNKEILTNKKGVYILPQKGDIGIGIDAAPFLEYFGKMLSDTGAEAPLIESPKLSLFGKYFIKEDLALRGSLKLNFGHTKKSLEGMGSEDYPSTSPEDYFTENRTDIGLSFGIEKRRGYRRLQGYYGADFGMGLTSNNGKYVYARIDQGQDGVEYPLSYKTNRFFKLSLMAFVGLEYYFAPKMSIGGEFAYGFSAAFGSNSTLEVTNKSNAITRTQILGGNEISFANTSGSLRLMFYF